jgi:hypothetical protein
MPGSVGRQRAVYMPRERRADRSRDDRFREAARRERGSDASVEPAYGGGWEDMGHPCPKRPAKLLARLQEEALSPSRLLTRCAVIPEVG